MQISIISCSHRKNSQSKKVSDILSKNLLNFKTDLKIFSLDLALQPLPLWSTEKKSGKGVWGDTWNNISNNLLIRSFKFFLRIITHKRRLYILSQLF